MVQDEAHQDERNINILKYQKENISRRKSSISIPHTAGQNNKNQKEICLKSVYNRKQFSTKANHEKIIEIV